MNENFQKALNFVLKWEGGYSFDPSDPGGETHWGISKKAHPDLDIKNLTQEAAGKIYLDDYWKKAGCNTLPAPLDLIIFDTAVNMGVTMALALMQDSKDWRDYLLKRIALYARIVKPGTAKYFRGWINRVLDLYFHVKNLVR
jgi:lysozyme family protein